MRLAFDPQPRLDCPAIEDIPLNLNCRDEIIPLLRALQHLYSDTKARQELLRLVGLDVNGKTSAKHGRKGMNYWQIVVLAGARLGCGLDYDKLQDLAEEHRKLRWLMGLGDWDEQVDFDWRCIRDNVCKLRPQTIERLNQVLVGVGHRLQPEAVQSIRIDSFVTETNIHYPTDSSLLGDGLRKILDLAVALARTHGVSGWRQHQHWRKKIQQQLRHLNRVGRKKQPHAPALRRGYQELLAMADELLDRSGTLLLTVQLRLGRPQTMETLTGCARELAHYRKLTAQVCTQARRRVLQGETVPHTEKIFSIFEPETELINKGKQPQPIQFGHQVLVAEDSVGLIVYYEVMGNGVTDAARAVPVVKELQKRYGKKVQRVSFDRGFHSPENQEELARLLAEPCLPAKGAEQGRRQQQEASVAFREARQNHPGVESAIGALQRGNDMERCRDRTYQGYQRYIGLGVLGRNLLVLGKLLIARENATCAAATSKRKRRAG